MKSTDRTVVWVPVSPLHLLNVLGTLPITQQQIAARLPSRGRTHHSITFGVTLDITAARRLCSVHYQRLEPHHQMSQRCCMAEASCRFMNFPSRWAHLLMLLEGEGMERKSFHGIQLFSHRIFCDCLALDFMAMNLNRWNSDKEIIQHRN